MKRIVFVVICVVLAFSLLGCGAAPSFPETIASQPEGGAVESTPAPSATAVASPAPAPEETAVASPAPAPEETAEKSALASDDFEIIYRGGTAVSIEEIEGGDVLHSGGIQYYGYRFSENDATNRGINRGSTLQEAADAYPNMPVLSGAYGDPLWQYASVHDLLESDHLQDSVSFAAAAFVFDGILCSYEECIGLLQEAGYSADSQTFGADLASFSERHSVVVYEMAVYYRDVNDGVRGAQTPIEFINLRKSVYG